VTGVAIETLQPNFYGARALRGDALHLGRVQRINLLPALMGFLVANMRCEVEQRAKAIFEHRVALDLAANVTDDTAKPGAQELKLPPARLKWCAWHRARP
jgi:hypothetical protein